MMGSLNSWIGKKVTVNETEEGTLRFYGETNFAKGLWCGVELNSPRGDNNGSVDCVSYFVCKDQHGIFAPESQVKKINNLAFHIKNILENDSFELYISSSVIKQRLSRELSPVFNNQDGLNSVASCNNLIQGIPISSSESYVQNNCMLHLQNENFTSKNIENSSDDSLSKYNFEVAKNVSLEDISNPLLINFSTSFNNLNATKDLQNSNSFISIDKRTAENKVNFDILTNSFGVFDNMDILDKSENMLCTENQILISFSNSSIECDMENRESCPESLPKYSDLKLEVNCMYPFTTDTKGTQLYDFCTNDKEKFPLSSVNCVGGKNLAMFKNRRKYSLCNVSTPNCKPNSKTFFNKATTPDQSIKELPPLDMSPISPAVKDIFLNCNFHSTTIIKSSNWKNENTVIIVNSSNSSCDDLFENNRSFHDSFTEFPNLILRENCIYPDVKSHAITKTENPTYTQSKQLSDLCLNNEDVATFRNRRNYTLCNVSTPSCETNTQTFFDKVTTSAQSVQQLQLDVCPISPVAKDSSFNGTHSPNFLHKSLNLKNNDIVEFCSTLKDEIQNCHINSINRSSSEFLVGVDVIKPNLCDNLSKELQLSNQLQENDVSASVKCNFNTEKYLNSTYNLLRFDSILNNSTNSHISELKKDIRNDFKIADKYAMNNTFDIKSHFSQKQDNEQLLNSTVLLSQGTKYRNRSERIFNFTFDKACDVHVENNETSECEAIVDNPNFNKTMIIKATDTTFINQSKNLDSNLTQKVDEQELKRIMDDALLKQSSSPSNTQFSPKSTKGIDIPDEKPIVFSNYNNTTFDKTEISQGTNAICLNQTKELAIELSQTFVGESEYNKNSKNTVLKGSSPNFSLSPKAKNADSQDEKTIMDSLNDKTITQETDLIYPNKSKNSAVKLPELLFKGKYKSNLESTVLKRSSNTLSLPKSTRSTDLQNVKTTIVSPNCKDRTFDKTELKQAAHATDSKKLALKLPLKFAVGNKLKIIPENTVVKRSSSNTFPLLSKSAKSTDLQNVKTTIDSFRDKADLKQGSTAICATESKKLALKLPIKCTVENKLKRIPDNAVTRRSSVYTNTFPLSPKLAKSADFKDVKTSIDSFRDKAVVKEGSGTVCTTESKKLYLKLPIKCSVENKLKGIPDNAVMRRSSSNTFPLLPRTYADLQDVKTTNNYLNKTGIKQQTGAICQSKALALKLPVKCTVENKFKGHLENTVQKKAGSNFQFPSNSAESTDLQDVKNNHDLPNCIDKTEKRPVGDAIGTSQFKKNILKSPNKFAVESKYKLYPENAGLKRPNTSLKKPNTGLKMNLKILQNSTSKDCQNEKKLSLIPYSNKVQNVTRSESSKSEMNMKNPVGSKMFKQDFAESNSMNLEEKQLRRSTNIKFRPKSPCKPCEETECTKKSNCKIMYAKKAYLNDKENNSIGGLAIPKRNFISKLKKPS